MTAKVFRLKCSHQTYAWGKPGASSTVALLLQSTDKTFVPCEKTTYAELWMGTHPKGPSMIESSGESLAEWIRRNPGCLGNGSSLSQLPFLFKVLSVNIALSIQVHPDKPTAERLHKRDPTQYGDDNHKPEMAVALTTFEALCGFRPKAEIIRFLNDVIELREIVGVGLVDKLSTDSGVKALRDCFAALMTCDPAIVEKQLNSLVHRLRNAHCLECMACSDNVVRAGLTPKHKDVETLCSILEYSFQSVSEIQFPSVSDPLDHYVTLYDPPVSEFTIAKIQIPADVQSYKMASLDGASIAIVLNGCATADNGSLGGSSFYIKRGSVFFISSNESVLLTISSTDIGLLVFRAYCVV